MPARSLRSNFAVLWTRGYEKHDDKIVCPSVSNDCRKASMDESQAEEFSAVRADATHPAMRAERVSTPLARACAIRAETPHPAIRAEHAIPLKHIKPI